MKFYEEVLKKHFNSFQVTEMFYKILCSKHTYMFFTWGEKYIYLQILLLNHCPENSTIV